MGGNTSLNGRLDLYASMPVEALKYEKKGKLVGFGFAPEGIENNEIVYELISDMGWTDQVIDIDKWIKAYCIRRYGAFPVNMEKAFRYFRSSCFGSFADHPSHSYQHRPGSKETGTVNRSDDFGTGTGLFLSCRDSVKNISLFTIDAIEFTCQYLGLKADKLIEKFYKQGSSDYELIDEAISILTTVDKLLESHPEWKLKNWTDFAAGWGDTPEEKAYYVSNAKRLITTWGGENNEYAAKTWSGLLRDYYIPRWKLFSAAKKNSSAFDMLKWEENWIPHWGGFCDTALPRSAGGGVVLIQ